MTIEKAIEDIKKADLIIKKQHRYPCGIESDDTNLKEDKARLFFSSPDGQNGEFYYELKKLGWRHSKYQAEYYWSVRKEDIVIQYVEGDVYITKTNEE